MHIQAASVGLLALASVAAAAPAKCKRSRNVELGPRPEYIVNDMVEGELKDTLTQCLEKESHTTKWSIGHRGGGTLQFPEETLESVTAGLRMGAGIQECDTAFTSDRELVCRHSQCDLAFTTNIVNTPLNEKCTQPFQPASGDQPASATCCTSDITLDEFLSLCGKMEGQNDTATNPYDFLAGAPSWRTELYGAQCSTTISHKQFVEHIKEQGDIDFTTELKAPEVPMPFDGDYTYDMYRQQVVDEYVEAGIDPKRVWLQSFVYEDVLYWLENAPEFGKQAVLLDESGDTPETYPDAVAALQKYKDAGVQVIAPPLPYLVVGDEDGKYVPSTYADEAMRLGFKIITWSLERSPPLRIAGENEDYYYMYMANATTHDGDIYELVNVLDKDIGVIGIFSDWSATVTFYANCMGLFP